MQLGLSFDFGFMLLNPWSDLSRVLNNLRFLEAFVGDGAAPAGFCRTLPYAGTAVEHRLAAEGRLRRAGFDSDYDFLDPRLDAFCRWMLETFADRHCSPNGTLALLQILVLQAHLDFPDAPADPVLRDTIHALTAVSNQAAVDAATQAAEYLADGADDSLLLMLRDQHAAQDRQVRTDLAALLCRRPGILERMAFALDETRVADTATDCDQEAAAVSAEDEIGSGGCGWQERR